MAGPVSLTFEFQENVTAAFARAVAADNDMSPAMREIARHLETSTRMRFETETGPSGAKWRPSRRVIEQGGQTLTLSGDLRGSIGSNFTQDTAEAGPEKSFGAAIYAAIHQFGGTIRPKAKRALSFGGRIYASVRIPARPYLGINDDDREAVTEIVMRHIAKALGQAGGDPSAAGAGGLA